MRRLAIGLRLTLWYVAIFALGEIIFGASMWLILRHNLYDLVDDGVESQFDDLKNFLASQPKDVPAVRLREQMAAIYDHEHAGDFLEVYDERGVSIYCSRFLRTHQPMCSQSDPASELVFLTQRIGGTYFRFTCEKLNINGHAYTIKMGASADDAVDTLRLFRMYVMVFALLLLLVFTAVGIWMSRKALAPVDALVRTAREISGANLDRRLDALNSGDELQRLTDTLNEMLDRIESAFQRIARFTADASHELRTPVSLIRTEAELALRRSRTDREYKDALRHILHESERTTLLIEQLLEMARADSAGESLTLHPVNLSDILRGVAASWRQVAAARELGFSEEISDQDISVAGDPTLLRRLSDILLDNAFKYTPSPGTVHIALAAREETVLLTVQDSGVGIAEEDHEKVFERFYRVDKARSRAQGGVGLGLAIAKWIVLQHRGEIAVESRPGEGARFRVRLPLVAVDVPGDLLAK